MPSSGRSYCGRVAPQSRCFFVALLLSRVALSIGSGWFLLGLVPGGAGLVPCRVGYASGCVGS